MACYLSSVPNEWGCHDPQCNDSTWDHECPTGPCDVPAHQAKSGGDAAVSADQPEWTAPAEAVIAFLDGDGCDDEAFASLRRRLTLATPWILDSAAGTAEKRGAVKALAKANDDLLNLRDTLREKRGGSHTRWALGVEDAAFDVRVLARRIESGEVTLP